LPLGRFSPESPYQRYSGRGSVLRILTDWRAVSSISESATVLDERGFAHGIHQLEIGTLHRRLAAPATCAASLIGIPASVGAGCHNERRELCVVSELVFQVLHGKRRQIAGCVEHADSWVPVRVFCPQATRYVVRHKLGVLAEQLSRNSGSSRASCYAVQRLPD